MARRAGDAAERLVGPRLDGQDAGETGTDPALRPVSLADFVGQHQARKNLRIFIEAARARRQALDHVLLSGPPGLGKTTLAQIISHELGAGFRATVAPAILKAGDLAALLAQVQAHDVLFIDEIHRLPPAAEEMLYSAMEDFQLDLIIGEGPAARSMRIELPPFTLVGATTRSGLLTRPLRERFGIPIRLQFYKQGELELIVNRAARLLDLEIDDKGAAEIARRSRGTPRVASRLLRRVRDFAEVADIRKVDAAAADAALNELEVDRQGFDAMDRCYLACMADNYGGGPVGIQTLAAALGEQRDVLEEVVEPYLIQQGMLQRTSRGRILGEKGFRYLGRTPPEARLRQLDLAGF